MIDWVFAMIFLPVFIVAFVMVYWWGRWNEALRRHNQAAERFWAAVEIDAKRFWAAVEHDAKARFVTHPAAPTESITRRCCTGPERCYCDRCLADGVPPSP